jgi:toxin ParE1/3/4
MNLPVVFRPEAQADLLLARDWYERQRADLGEAFGEAVEEVLGRIVALPELCEVVLRDVRRRRLRRFPYIIYYRVLADRIEVLAVLHGSRDSATWQKRIRPAEQS